MKKEIKYSEQPRQGGRTIRKASFIETEMYEILDLIVAEWQSDPMSVACFDLRIVERAKNIVAVYKEEQKRRDYERTSGFIRSKDNRRRH